CEMCRGAFRFRSRTIRARMVYSPGSDARPSRIGQDHFAVRRRPSSPPVRARRTRHEGSSFDRRACAARRRRHSRRERAAAAARPPHTTAPAPTDVRAAFFTNWSRYARGYFVKQIPADKLNVLDYAFGAPTAAGTCGLTDPSSDYHAPTAADQSVDGVADDSADPNQHLYGNFNQLLKLKAAHPNLHVVMSLGGWTGSVYFSDVAATA